ncbi:MAG: hypothetical protein IAE67_04435, partial [Candidatus Competibacteraceae bacterium]|nr:hypothetical protein [Candidatus Competibacteraceae bacterium]
MKVLSSLIVSLGLIFNFAFSQHTMFTQTWKQESTEFSSTIVYSVDMKTTGGNIYHIGKVHNGSNWDVVVAKVNNAGSVLWRQQYDGGTDDFAISVGVDNSGNVYAIMRSIISGTSRARVVKYNTSGTYQWVWNTTTGVTGQFPNYGYTDASGNTYVVGTDGANNSILTYKITTAGAISFSAVYAPNSSLRNSSQVITDATSNVYVCGWQNTASSGTDWVVLKYNSSGTQQWVQTYGGTGNDTAKTIIVDGASNIIVGGRYSSTEAHVRKYTPTGTASWTNTVNYFIDANSSVILQVDNSNNIYAAVCQQDYVSNNKPLHIKKISTSGASLWNKYYNGPTATYSQPSDYFQNYPKQILVHNDSNYVYVGIDGPSKSNIGSIRRGFHISRFRMTDGSFDDDLDNVSHNFCYPELAFTTTIAFADNNQSIIIAGSHPDMSYSTPPLKIRTVKYGLYSPAVKAHGPSYLLSTKMSYIKLCDLNARNVSDSCRLEPTGIQSGYSYWWVSTNVSNEDALTQYFTDRSNPNSYFNPPAGFFSANYKLKITDLFGNIIYSSPVSIQRYAFDNSVVTSGSTNICNGDTVTLSMPQIDIQYSLANMVKIGSPNQNLQSYAGSYASSNQPLIYNATTSGQFFFDVECTPIVSLNAYSGYNFMSTTFGGCFYYSDTISVTLGTPTITGTTPGSRCGTGTVTLGATGSAGTLSWYATPTGGSALGTGTSFVTPSISSTTTYYVEAVSGSCTSSRTAVTATI